MEPKLFPQLPLIVFSPFPGSLTHLGSSKGAPKPNIGQFFYCSRRILNHILTFPDPPCQPGQTFLVQNGLYMCPTYSTHVLCSTLVLKGKMLTEFIFQVLVHLHQQRERKISLPPPYELPPSYIQVCNTLLFCF